jgi:DNA-binding NarL/FixJ family response regulator
MDPTKRQLQIIKLLAAGMTREQIGDRLYLSPNTVKTHVQRMLDVFKAKNSTNLVHLAHRKGWIE